MAGIIVAGIGYGLVSAAQAAGYSATAIGLIAAATAAVAIGASYLDQRYIYPAIFGKNSPRQDVLGGIDVMTGQDGSPGHTSWGRVALVGGHVLWFENLQTINSQISSKKGDGVTQTKRIADVGVGLTRNLIQQVEQINADQKVFWRRDPNNVLWADFRVTFSTVTYSTANDTLRLAANDAAMLQFEGLFDDYNVVEMRGAEPAGVNGLWMVRDVGGPGALGFIQGYLDLRPLQGQDPTLFSAAGSDVRPLEIRRKDTVIAGQLMFIDQSAAFGDRYWLLSIDEATAGSSEDRFTRIGLRGSGRMHQVWKTGIAIRVTNMPLTPQYEGRYGILSTFPSSNSTLLVWVMVPLDGQPLPTIPPDTTQLFGSTVASEQPTLVTIEGEEGFLQPAGETLVRYIGSESEVADPDLSAVYGAANVHGYRGLARVTIRDMNLTNWGDRVPSLAGVVKVSDIHTTHNVIRDLMRETFRRDDSRYTLAELRPEPLLGYTRRGQQNTTQTLQPLTLAYGIEAQERGKTWAFFKAEDAHVRQLARYEMGAYVGDYKPGQRFDHTRVQDRDLPRRLSFFYRDPLNDFTRTEKNQRASIPSDAKDDEVILDVDPIVLYPWAAQNRVNALYAASLVARDQGSIALGFSHIDLLPGDRVTFTALNWNREDVVIAGGSIDHETTIKDVEPFSISIEVDFETSGRCRLVDDGDGALIGIPAGITVSVNAIDYAAGTIELTASEDVIDATIHYEFPNDWRMRIQNIQRRHNGVMECQVVAVAESFPFTGSPVETERPNVGATLGIPHIVGKMVDVAGPWPWQLTPALLWVASHVGNPDAWRGVGVYSSTDGINYTLRAAVANPVVMAVAYSSLGTGVAGVVDWTEELVLAMQDDAAELTSATLDEVGDVLARNWLLVGNEIVAFLEAEEADPADYGLDPETSRRMFVCRGLIRGMRDTEDEMAGHTAGETVVLLDQLGLFDPSVLEELSPFEIGQNLWLKFVPPGGVVSSYEAVQVTVQANNVRPFSVGMIAQGDILTNGYEWSPADLTYDPSEFLAGDVSIRWWRRTNFFLPPFGAGASGGGPIPANERYLVEVLRNGTVLGNRTQIIGGASTGSPMVHRVFRYTLAEQTADALASTDTVTIRVREIGLGGASGLGKPASISWTIP